MTTAAAYLSVKDVAEFLSVDADAVRSLIHSDALAAVDVSAGRKRRTWRVSRQSLDDFLIGRANRPAVPKPTRRRRAMAVTEFFP
jgi:excisionase family DNA binding protein